MPIKTITMLLSIVTLAVMVHSETEILAQANTNYARSVDTRINFGLRKMRYRVITTGSAVSTAPTATQKDKDVFRITILGVQIQDRDRISFTISGADGTVDLGSPTFTGDNAFLELRRRRATGTLGAAPYLFPKARLRFNPIRGRMNFFSGKGRAQATPVLSAIGATPNNLVTVTMHVQRPGEGDCDFVFTGTFRIRHTVLRRKQLHVYRANGQ